MRSFVLSYSPRSLFPAGYQREAQTEYFGSDFWNADACAGSLNRLSYVYSRAASGTAEPEPSMG